MSTEEETTKLIDKIKAMKLNNNYLGEDIFKKPFISKENIEQKCEILEDNIRSLQRFRVPGMGAIIGKVCSDTNIFEIDFEKWQKMIDAGFKPDYEYGVWTHLLDDGTIGAYYGNSSDETIEDATKLLPKECQCVFGPPSFKCKDAKGVYITNYREVAEPIKQQEEAPSDAIPGLKQ